MSRLLTPRELAEMLQVKPSTIYQWVHEGFIPHVKVGRLVRFREGDVSRWIDARTKSGRVSRTISATSLGI